MFFVYLKKNFQQLSITFGNQCGTVCVKIMLTVELTKARSHVEKILTNLPALISSASISSYQLIQLVAVNLYALFHLRRRGGTTAGVSVADVNGPHHNGDVDANCHSENSTRPTTPAQHAAYDKLLFSFTGSFELMALCGIQVVRIDPLRFLAGCRKRRPNQSVCPFC